MPQVDPVILQLRADLRDYSAKLTLAQREADRRLSAIEKRGEAMGRNVADGFNMMTRAALGYVSVMAAVSGAREFLRIADAAKSIEAQLRLATRESGSFAQAQEDVRRVALATRSELAATSDLYGNFMRNARELGITQAEAARATETVSKSFKISGANAVESAQGTRQLVQALQSGVLRGDEFNTIMESSPRLAKAFADSLGVTVGELRAMAEEGKLTSDKLVRALTDPKFTKSIDEEFRELPVTFNEAMTQVETSAIKVFGAFDRGGQFSTAIASFVDDGAAGFADLERAAESFGATVSSEFAGIIATFRGVLNTINSINLAMGGIPARLGQDAWILDYLNPAGAIKRFVLDNPEAKAARDQQYAENALGIVNRGAPFADYRNAWYNRGGGSTAPRSRTGATKSGGKRKGPSAETLANRAEAERTKTIREDAAKQREIAQLNDDILGAKAALAVASQDVLEFQLQQIDSDRKQRVADLMTDQELGVLDDKEVEARIKLIDEIVSARRAKAFLAKSDADFAMSQAEARDESETLKMEAQLLKSREARRDAEQRILDLAYQEEEAAIRRAAANGEIADLDTALANMRRRQLADNETLKRGSASPGQKYLEGIRNEAENLGDAYEDIAVRGLDRMNSEIVEMTKNALGLHGVFGDIIGDLIEMAFRQAVLGPLADALFGGGGGGGLLGSLFGSAASAASGAKVITGKKALGGPVSAGGTYLVGERGPELLQMGGRDGYVVPNHALARGGAGGGGTATVRLELSGDIDARIARVSGPVAVEVVRASAPSLIDASARETIARSRRPGL